MVSKTIVRNGLKYTYVKTYKNMKAAFNHKTRLMQSGYSIRNVNVKSGGIALYKRRK
jgi:hypothetical protein